MALKKINVGDKATEVSEKIEFNFNEVIAMINQLNNRIDYELANPKRYFQNFIASDFSENKMEVVLPSGWTTNSNITVLEKNADATYSKVIADINIINDITFEILSDIPFNGKVVVSYD